jgi:hypothetical protein
LLDAIRLKKRIFFYDVALDKIAVALDKIAVALDKIAVALSGSH